MYDVLVLDRDLPVVHGDEAWPADDRIGDADPVIGAELDVTVRTGARRSYAPALTTTPPPASAGRSGGVRPSIP